MLSKNGSKRNSFRKENLRKSSSSKSNKSNNSFLPKTLDQALSEVPHYHPHPPHYQSETNSKGSSNPQQPPSVESDDNSSCYSDGTDAYSLAFSEIHREDVSELTQPSGGSGLFTPYNMGGGLMEFNVGSSMRSMSSSQNKGSSRKLLDTLYQDDDEEDDDSRYGGGSQQRRGDSGGGSDESTVATNNGQRQKQNTSLLAQPADEGSSSEDEQLLLYKSSNSNHNNNNNNATNLYQDDTETPSHADDDGIFDQEQNADYYDYNNNHNNHNNSNEDDMISAYGGSIATNSMARAVLEQVDRDVDDESILETESIASIFLYGGMNSMADSVCSANRKSSRRASLDLRQLKLQKQQSARVGLHNATHGNKATKMEYQARRNSLDSTFRPDWGVEPVPNRNSNSSNHTALPQQQQQQPSSSKGPHHEQPPRRNSLNNTATQLLLQHRRSSFTTPKAADDFVDQIIEQKIQVRKQRMEQERRKRREEAQYDLDESSEYSGEESSSSSGMESSEVGQALAKHVLEI